MSNFEHLVTTALLTIPNGEDTSNSVNTMKITPQGVVFPVTTQTAFTFEVSQDNDTFYALKDKDDAAITVTKTAASTSAHPLSSDNFVGWNFIRLKAGGNEGAEREILLTGLKL